MPGLGPAVAAGALPDAAAVGATTGEDGPRRTPLDAPGPGPACRLLGRLESLARPSDASARILLLGLVGFLPVLLLEMTVTAVALGVPLVEALYIATK